LSALAVDDAAAAVPLTLTPVITGLRARLTAKRVVHVILDTLFIEQGLLLVRIFLII
jgi:hypothetical protein